MGVLTIRTLLFGVCFGAPDGRALSYAATVFLNSFPEFIR